MAIETPDFQSVAIAPATHLQTVNLAAGPSSQTVNVQPPPGTHALGFTTNLLDGKQSVGLVQGHVSGANYWNGNLIIANPTNGRPAILPVFCDPSFENSFDVNVGNQGVGPAKVEIFAVRDTEAVSMLPAYPGPTLSAAALSVVLATDQAILNALALKKGWDAQGVSAPGGGVVASVTLPAPGPNLRYQLDQIVATLLTVAAVSQTPDLQIKDGATVIWQVTLSVPATAFSTDKIVVSDMGLKQPSTNQALTVAFSANTSGNIFERLSVGAYITN